jgi:hypothetical protein
LRLAGERRGDPEEQDQEVHDTRESESGMGMHRGCSLPVDISSRSSALPGSEAVCPSSHAGVPVCESCGAAVLGHSYDIGIASHDVKTFFRMAGVKVR